MGILKIIEYFQKYCLSSNQLSMIDYQLKFCVHLQENKPAAIRIHFRFYIIDLIINIVRKIRMVRGSDDVVSKAEAGKRSILIQGLKKHYLMIDK